MELNKTLPESKAPAARTIEDPTARRARLNFTCPACMAQPGDPCTVATDTSRAGVGWLHIAREGEVTKWLGEGKPITAYAGTFASPGCLIDSEDSVIASEDPIEVLDWLLEQVDYQFEGPLESDVPEVVRNSEREVEHIKEGMLSFRTACVRYMSPGRAWPSTTWLTVEIFGEFAFTQREAMRTFDSDDLCSLREPTFEDRYGDDGI